MIAQERRLYALIRKTLRQFIPLVRAELEAHGAQYLRADSIPTSPWGGAMEKLMRKQKELFEAGVKTGLFVSLRQIGKSVERVTGREWERFTTGVFGQRFEYSEVAPTIERWATTNFSLCKKLSTEYIDRMNDIVMDAVNRGAHVEEVLRELRSLDSTMTRARAKLIARDQMGKLHSHLARERQVSVGIDSYEWSTSVDERVRESHALMEGKLCQWGDNTVWSDDGQTWTPRYVGAPIAAPGEEIQCRCVALARVDRLIEELESF